MDKAFSSPDIQKCVPIRQADVHQVYLLKQLVLSLEHKISYYIFCNVTEYMERSLDVK